MTKTTTTIRPCGRRPVYAGHLTYRSGRMGD